MPPALFVLGEIDPFRDDSQLMAERWAEVAPATRLDVPDAPHGFQHFGAPAADDNHVLEVGAGQSVGGAHGPPVGIDRHTRSAAVDHRLDAEGHSLAEQLAAAAMPLESVPLIIGPPMPPAMPRIVPLGRCGQRWPRSGFTMRGSFTGRRGVGCFGDERKQKSGWVGDGRQLKL